MIEVEMSKDIRDCEPKLLGPFTKRQVICIVISLAYGAPVFFLLGFGMDLFLRILISIILMAPAIACGWCDMYGMPLEKFGIHIFKTLILSPQKRLYKSKNMYEEFYSELEEDNAEKKVKRSKKDGRIL